MKFVCPSCKAEFEAEEAPPTCPQCGSPMREGPQYFGDFELIGLLSQSDIAFLYRARSTRTGRIIALKVLVTEAGASGEELSLLVSRAQRAAGLSHENIAELVRVGEVEGVPYAASEFVEGKPLGRFLTESSLSVSEGLSLAESVAQGLEHAHSEGLVHGNLKPNNIIIDNLGNPKLADFGFARELKALSGAGRKLSLPYYLSPEQVRGEEPDARSDVWGLGAVMYHMLCGKPPFEANDLTGLLRKILSGEIRPPRFLNPKLPRTVDAIVSRCLALDPAARYQSARALIKEFDATLSRGPVAALEGSPNMGLFRGLGRHGLAVAAAALLAAGAATGGWFVSRGLTSSSSASRARRAVERSKEALEKEIWGEAEEYARKAADSPALERDEEAYIHYCLGRCAESRGVLDGAIEEYERILEIADGNANVLSRMGRCAYSSGDYEGAARFFEKEIGARTADDPRRGHASLRLGYALWRLGDLDRAAKALAGARGYGAVDAKAKRALEELEKREALTSPH